MANELTGKDLVTTDDTRVPNPSGVAGMLGNPDDAAAGKPTPGISADAPAASSPAIPALDAPPGTSKKNQPGKDASGNAHQMDEFAVMGWVDHPNIAADGTVYNAHSPGMVVRKNPLKHQGEEVSPGHTEANPLTYATQANTSLTPTITPSAFPTGTGTTGTATTSVATAPVTAKK